MNQKKDLEVKSTKILLNLIQFLSTTTGRDKSCRLLQYLSKIAKAFFNFLWKKTSNNMYLDIETKFDSFGYQMSMTRKVLRFGRNFGIAKNLYDLLNNYTNKLNYDEYNPEYNFFFVLFNASSNISLMLFYFFDHFLFLGKLGVIKSSEFLQKTDFLSNLFWLSECVFSIIANNIEIYIRNKKISEKFLNNELHSEVKSLNNKIESAIIDITKNIIDIPIAISFLKESFISSWLTGLFGSCSSYIGCYQNWNKE